MKRLPPLMVLLAVLTTACSDSGNSVDGSSEFSTTTEAVAGPEPPDDGCTSDYPIRLPVAPELALLVTACDSVDRLSAQITNESAVVLTIRPRDIVATTWTPLPGPGDLADQVVMSTVPGGVRLGNYWLLPRHTVIVSSAQEPALSIELPVDAGATAFAASYIAGWVDGLTQRPSDQLVSALEGCVRGAAEILQTSSAWEDTIRAGIQTVPLCRSVVQEVRGLDDPPTIARSADDIVRTGSRFGVSDDFARLLGKVARLFP